MAGRMYVNIVNEMTIKYFLYKKGIRVATFQTLQKITYYLALRNIMK